MNEIVHVNGVPDGAGLPGTPQSAVLALLRDLVPAVGDALLVGRLAAQVAHHAAGRMSSVSVLLQAGDPLPPVSERVSLHVGDPQAELHQLSQGHGAPRFTLVMLVEDVDALAIDEQGGTPWSNRLQVGASLLAPGGCLVVGVAPDIPALSAGPRVTCAGLDPTRPASPTQLRESLAAVGHPGAAVHCAYGPPGDATCIVAEDLARACREGDVPSAAVAAAIEDDELGMQASGVAFGPTVRAGLLPMLASGWIAVAGGSGRGMYVRTRQGVTLSADRPVQGRTWQFMDAESGEPGGLRQVPAGPTLESSLLGALASGDLTGFRQLASGFGSWVRNLWAAGDDRPCVALDRVHQDERGIGPALWAPAPPSFDDPDEAIAWAWLRFDDRNDDRVIGAWEKLSTRPERIAHWVGFSGVADPTSALDAVAHAMSPTRDAGEPLPAEPPVTTQGHADSALIAALRGAIRERNTQLSHREQALRRLRAALLSAEEERERAQRELNDVLVSRAYRTGARLEAARNPRELRRAIADRGVRLNERLAHVARQVR